MAINMLSPRTVKAVCLCCFIWKKCMHFPVISHHFMNKNIYYESMKPLSTKVLIPIDWWWWFSWGSPKIPVCRCDEFDAQGNSSSWKTKIYSVFLFCIPWLSSHIHIYHTGRWRKQCFVGMDTKTKKTTPFCCKEVKMFTFLRQEYILANIYNICMYKVYLIR